MSHGRICCARAQLRGINVLGTQARTTCWTDLDVMGAQSRDKAGKAHSVAMHALPWQARAGPADLGLSRFCFAFGMGLAISLSIQAKARHVDGIPLTLGRCLVPIGSKTGHDERAGNR